MNGTSSNTCFFSFGPEDSFISKSYEGLRYHDLPPTLLTLLTSGNVVDVHWASLGPTPTSWLLSFKDSSSTHNLAWGPSIPSRLEKIVSKLTPSPHLRVFLGPEASYIAWDPTLIRWSNLPSRLEDTIQSWLTPSGWRSGPPRMVTWGPDDAFFAMSEYGDVAYRVGDRSTDDWSIWRETVAEWKAEPEFRWSEVAYVALDATTTDQFVAIRRDGTWAGSIADEGSAALEAFAHNFFRRAAKPKGKNKAGSGSESTSQSQSNSQSRSGSPPRQHAHTNGASGQATEPTPKPLTPDPDPAVKAAYEEWSTATALLFAGALAATMPSPSPSPSPPLSSTPLVHKRAPKKLQIRSQSSPSTLPPSSSTSSPHSSSPPPTLLTSFPYLPPPPTPCPLPSCLLQKSDPLGLRACKHDVEAVFRASGLYGYEWLRGERLRWHPDRFGRLCAEGWREEGRKVAEEMFKVIEILMGEMGRGR